MKSYKEQCYTRFYDHPIATEFDHRIGLMFFGNLRLQTRFNQIDASADDSSPLCTLVKTQPTSFECPQEYIEAEVCKLCGESEANKDVLASSTVMNEMYDEALIAFAGYLAHKHIKTHPQFGVRTCTVNVAILPKWLSTLSKGGLLNPSERLVSAVKNFELHFTEVNGRRGIHTCCNYSRDLVQRISTQTTFADIPVELVRSYAFTRSIIRIPFLAKCDIADANQRKLAKKKRKFVK